MGRLRKFLLEDEAVVGIRSPIDYLYVRILRLTLGIIRSWPGKEIGEYESRALTISVKWLNLFLFTMAFIGGICFFAIHFSALPFLEIGQITIGIMLSVNNWCRVFTLTFSEKYRDLAKDFLTKHNLFFYCKRSDYAMKTHKRVHVLSHIFTLYITIQMLLGLILFNLIPMYNNYSAGRFKAGGTKNSTFELSIIMSYPFNTSTNINGYIVACIINWILSYLCGTLCCIFDLFLSIMIFHVWGHFKILINTLDEFPHPILKSCYTLEDGSIINAEMYSNEELLQVSIKLKECIDYHRQIITFIDRLSNIFGPMLFVYIVFHQASGCILLLECAQMTAPALLRYLPLTFILFQALIQLSTIFELIGTVSGQLKDAVYGLPWECMDINNKKIVLFFMMNVQEPVHLKAMGVANVGVTSMAQILKTSLSYFTFLRSV